MEIYKDIKNYEGRYMISNYGNVKSLERTCDNKYNKNRIYRECIYKPSICTGGYLYVSLTDLNNKKKRIRVHRLVADAFITNIDSKIDVNHKDGNKKNNHVDNLEWVTRSENLSHAYKMKLRSKKHVLTNDEAYAIKYKLIGFTQLELAKIFNCSQMAISNLKRGLTYKEV